MLESLIEDRDFSKIMKKHIAELLVLFFQKEQNFEILCKIEDISFNPKLPDDISTKFQPLTLFSLEGYTFETAHIENEMLIFEAGFGSENFGSVVSVPLLNILQIIVDKSSLFINIAVENREKEEEKSKNIDGEGVKNSMESFLANPENLKFLKKR